jgi:hypothetical protein
MHREGFEPSQLGERQFYRLPALTNRRPVLINTAIQLSNIKSERSGYSGIFQ